MAKAQNAVRVSFKTAFMPVKYVNHPKKIGMIHVSCCALCGYFFFALFSDFAF